MNTDFALAGWAGVVVVGTWVCILLIGITFCVWLWDIVKPKPAAKAKPLTELGPEDRPTAFSVLCSTGGVSGDLIRLTIKCPQFPNNRPMQFHPAHVPELVKKLNKAYAFAIEE